MFLDTPKNGRRRNSGEKNGWVNCYFCFLCTKKSILVASQNWSWATDVTWTVLPKYLYVSGPGNILVALLSMEDQIALWFNKKYLNFCSEDERRSYGFGTTWGWVINDRILILGWTIPLSSSLTASRILLLFKERKQNNRPMFSQFVWITLTVQHKCMCKNSGRFLWLLFNLTHTHEYNTSSYFLPIKCLSQSS